MKKKFFAAFLLNLFFSVFELIGGLFTGSVAIMSDSLHDFGDALSIGLAVFLEKKSEKKPDSNYTYGYLRYSVLGSFITTMILIIGSALVILGAVGRLLNPQSVDYSGMIVFAVIGTAVNLIAAFITHGSKSLNEKAVSLHLLEDVLGWVVVLIGAIVMKFTDISVLDPLLSLGVAVFILVNAIKHLGDILDIFLEKKPKDVDEKLLVSSLLEIGGISDVHHIHIRSIDGSLTSVTMHIVCEGDFTEIKHKAKHCLKNLGIPHSTLELESPEEQCKDTHCRFLKAEHHHCHHHHH